MTRRRHAGVLFALLTAVVRFDASAAAATDCWPPPVTGTIVDPFRAPACPFCAGNRGIEYRVGAGSTVRAVASGRVTWSGSVAGITYVVVGHRDGRRATYGRLVSTTLRTGDAVVAGTVVGRASGSFHFGLRDGDRYVDPAPFIGRVVARPRLVPVDGTPPRPAPAPAVRCAVGGWRTASDRAVVPGRGPR